MTSDVPLAPFGGWPILVLLLVLVALLVWALSRYVSLGLELEVYERAPDVDVVDPIVENEGALLGAWTFFDQDAALDLDA